MDGQGPLQPGARLNHRARRGRRQQLAVLIYIATTCFLVVTLALNENAPTDQQASGLLIGARRINAARSRAEEASDNPGGKTDVNDT